MKKYFLLCVGIFCLVSFIAYNVTFAQLKTAAHANQFTFVVNNVTPTPTPTKIPTPTPPHNACLRLVKSPDGKFISFILCKLLGDIFKHFTYVLTYDANGIQEGVSGTGSFDGNSSQYTSSNILLGTCSSGTCVYDNDPHNFNLTVKMTNGSVIQNLFGSL